MKRFSGHEEEWGAFVDVKVNAAEVLAKQIKRTKRGSITFSTVTDPYQPSERKYELTRACLEVLAAYDFSISILTKSTLVLRDLDVFRRLKDVEVGFTITTLDEELRRIFEPRSSSVSARLAALAELADANVRTWAFCGPLLPFLSDDERRIDAVFKELKKVGVHKVVIDSMKLNGAIWRRVKKALERHYLDLVEGYRQLLANRRPYHEALMAKAIRIAEKYGIRCEACSLNE